MCSLVTFLHIALACVAWRWSVAVEEVYIDLAIMNRYAVTLHCEDVFVSFEMVCDILYRPCCFALPQASHRRLVSWPWSLMFAAKDCTQAAEDLTRRRHCACYTWHAAATFFPHHAKQAINVRF